MAPNDRKLMLDTMLKKYEVCYHQCNVTPGSAHKGTDWGQPVPFLIPDDKYTVKVEDTRLNLDIHGYPNFIVKLKIMQGPQVDKCIYNIYNMVTPTVLRRLKGDLQRCDIQLKSLPELQSQRLELHKMVLKIEKITSLWGSIGVKIIQYLKTLK